MFEGVDGIMHGSVRVPTPAGSWIYFTRWGKGPYFADQHVVCRMWGSQPIIHAVPGPGESGWLAERLFGAIPGFACTAPTTAEAAALIDARLRELGAELVPDEEWPQYGRLGSWPANRRPFGAADTMDADLVTLDGLAEVGNGD